MRKFVLSIMAASGIAAGLVVAVAGASASSNVTCSPSPGSNTFIGKMNVPGNLIVPPGDGCGLTQGSTVGHDVIVEKGASFFPGGTRIGHDVRANQAFLIELGDPNNGTTWTKVGHDVIINKTTGPEPYGNFICQTKIGHNLVIKNTRASATGWDIGYPEPPSCGRNSIPYDIIGHNATFKHNKNALMVGYDKVKGAIKFLRNSGAPEQLIDNSAKSCHQAHNHAFTGSGNRIRHGKKTNCNKL